jgi:hypothetical protein
MTTIAILVTGVEMVSKSDFMCRCNAESASECAAVLEEIKEYLQADDSNLLTYVVYELMEHDANIEAIVCDQWTLIITKKYDKSFETHVQCDRVEDGIARTLQLFQKHDKESDKIQ